MIKTLLLVIGFGVNADNYDHTARYNDSVLIYSTYQPAIEFLKKMKETDRQKWYTMEAEMDRLTACAKLRLKKYNGTDYGPLKVFDRSGFGVAPSYPKPGVTNYETPGAFAKVFDPKYHYVVYDKQTRFLCVAGSCLKIPYILKMVFDKGRMIFSEMLNPVTLEKLTSLTNDEVKTDITQNE